MPSMQFAIRPGDTVWKPPSVPAPRPSPQSPEILPWDEAGAKVGFAPYAPSLPGLTREQSAVLPGSQAYHGTFGPAVTAMYTHQNSSQSLAVTQRRLLQPGQEPLTFLYRASLASARVITIKSSPAVLVLPTADSAGSPVAQRLMPFVEWGPDDFWVTVNFFWNASEELILGVAHSLT